MRRRRRSDIPVVNNEILPEDWRALYVGDGSVRVVTISSHRTSIDRIAPVEAPDDEATVSFSNAINARIGCRPAIESFASVTVNVEGDFTYSDQNERIRKFDISELFAPAETRPMGEPVGSSEKISQDCITCDVYWLERILPRAFDMWRWRKQRVEVFTPPFDGA